MPKLTSSPAIIITFAVLCLFSIGISESCRKFDREISSNNDVNEVTRRFFGQHAPVDPLTSSIVGFMRRRNQIKDFVSTTVKRIGYPRWDKARTVKELTKPGIVGKDDDSAEITYIPFVRGNENFVNATLLVQTSATDTLYKYIFDWQYKNAPSGTLNDTIVTAEKIAATLMTLDKEVFGHTRFKITDSRLFENYSPDSLKGNQSYLELGSLSDNSNRTESMAVSFAFTVYCPNCVSMY